MPSKKLLAVNGQIDWTELDPQARMEMLITISRQVNERERNVLLSQLGYVGLQQAAQFTGLSKASIRNLTMRPDPSNPRKKTLVAYVMRGVIDRKYRLQDLNRLMQPVGEAKQ